MTISKKILAMVCGVFLAGFAPAALAQNSGTFSKIENRDCSIWNPSPQPNELIYWTGKCQNGLAEGHGILAYGVLTNSRPEVSLTDVTVKNGKQTGVGAYFSRRGAATRQVYEQGRTVSRTSINLNAYGQTIEQDIYASRFERGLVEGVTLADLKSLVEYAGHDVDLARDVNGSPIVSFKDNYGNTIYAAGTACLPNGGACRGIELLANLTSDSAISFEKINSFNYKYAIAKFVRDREDPKKISVGMYLILDAGQKPENIRLTLTNYSSLVSAAKKDLGVK